MVGRMTPRRKQAEECRADKLRATCNRRKILEVTTRPSSRSALLGTRDYAGNAEFGITGTASPPICWSTKRTSVSFRCCSGTRSWRPPRCTPRWLQAPGRRDRRGEVYRRCQRRTDEGQQGRRLISRCSYTRFAHNSDPPHRIVFHYTPKHRSWLSQIEIWFSILAGKVIRRGNFTSTDDLLAKLNAFIEYFRPHNGKALSLDLSGEAARSLINSIRPSAAVYYLFAVLAVKRPGPSESRCPYVPYPRSQATQALMLPCRKCSVRSVSLM